MKSRRFDISTLEGLKAAERYQARMYGQFDRVVVQTIGWDRVRIYGLHPIAPRRLGAGRDGAL